MERDPFVECLLAGQKEIGIELDQERIRRFVIHRDLLLRWGEKMNLTTVKDPVGMAEKLFLDCAAISCRIKKGSSVCDVGSGAGFPGLVLLEMDETIALTMIEARRKKVSFLETALRALELRAEVRWERFGWSGGPGKTFDEVVSRATFPPEEWLRLGAPLVRPGGRLWLMLGPSEEGDLDLRFLQPSGFSAAEVIEYRLPMTRSRRTLASYTRLLG